MAFIFVQTAIYLFSTGNKGRIYMLKPDKKFNLLLGND